MAGRKPCEECSTKQARIEELERQLESAHKRIREVTLAKDKEISDLVWMARQRP